MASQKVICSRFCSECGAADMRVAVPEGDNRERGLCGRCGAIVYSNPKIIAGAILENNGRILLCKRSIEPRKGYWTVPAGFMENAESVLEAAVRETLEEACAKAESLYLYGIYNLKHVNQVYMIYRGMLLDGQCAPGAETAEVLLCNMADIPWDDLAFPVIKYALEIYTRDYERVEFQVHEATLFRDESGMLQCIRYN